MRYAIVSDIHANLEALRAVLKDIKSQRVDKVICLGDIVGYYADPNTCTELCRNSGFICIRGNHDDAAIELCDIDDFNPIAQTASSGLQRNSNKNIRTGCGNCLSSLLLMSNSLRYMGPLGTLMPIYFPPVEHCRRFPACVTITHRLPSAFSAILIKGPFMRQRKERYKKLLRGHTIPSVTTGYF